MKRENCEEYPCHFPDQDCTLCFCPFYPCLDERTKGREENGAWICRDCIIVHRNEVSEAVMDALMNCEDLEKAWKKLEERL